MYTCRLHWKELLLAGMTLSESDLMYVLTLLRSSDRPMTTDELVAALRQRAGV